MNTIYRDISMTAGVRWDETTEFYNPLSNGLPNYDSPLVLEGWHASMIVKDKQGAGGSVLLTIDDTDNGGIEIADDGSLTSVMTADQTDGLRGLVGFYELRVTPTTGAEFDDIAAVGRIYVEDT